MSDPDGFTVAIAGLGLMGGSLALALKQGGDPPRVLGADSNPEAVRRALARGAVDAEWRDGERADLIVLAMPVRGIVQWLQTRGPALAPQSIVMDLGSTKREVVAAMDALAVESIGGHPMCGKETPGIEAADAGLFRGATFVLTPTARIGERALHAARDVIRRIGARELLLEAEAHDRAVAAISHLPYLLSALLVNTVGALGDPHAGALAASGYAGMTRLAASDTRMMGDIVATNRVAIVAMLDRYAGTLAELRAAIAAGDEAAWQGMLEEARRRKGSQ